MAVSSNVKDFLSKVKSGVKPNLFRVKLDWATGLGVSQADKEAPVLSCVSPLLSPLLTSVLSTCPSVGAL